MISKLILFCFLADAGYQINAEILDCFDTRQQCYDEFSNGAGECVPCTEDDDETTCIGVLSHD